MLYRYDKKQLVFRSLRLKTYLKIISFTILVFGISSFASYKLGVDRAINGLTEFEKVTIIKCLGRLGYTSMYCCRWIWWMCKSRCIF